MMFKQLLQPDCWRMSFALIWFLDIFSLILLRLVLSASLLLFLMLLLISEILSLLGLHSVFWLMMWSTISLVSNLDALHSASVFRWGFVTAIPRSRIGRAMSCRKCSEIDDSPGMKWFLRISSTIYKWFCIVGKVRLKKFYLRLKPCIWAE